VGSGISGPRQTEVLRHIVTISDLGGLRSLEARQHSVADNLEAARCCGVQRVVRRVPEVGVSIQIDDVTDGTPACRNGRWSSSTRVVADTNAESSLSRFAASHIAIGQPRRRVAVAFELEIPSPIMSTRIIAFSVASEPSFLATST